MDFDQLNIDWNTVNLLEDYEEILTEISETLFDGRISADVLLTLGILTILFSLMFILINLICMWLIYNKAKKPGWANFIPIYGQIVFLQIAGKPWWWFFLLLIPIVNLFVGLSALLGFVRGFGKGIGFFLGLLILPVLFIWILAFDTSVYRGHDKGKVNAV